MGSIKLVESESGVILSAATSLFFEVETPPELSVYRIGWDFFHCFGAKIPLARDAI
jgi:hypothetical protein